jgi:hypothetical protein
MEMSYSAYRAAQVEGGAQRHSHSKTPLRLSAGPEQFIEEVAEPCLEHFHLGLRYRIALGPIVRDGPLKPKGFLTIRVHLELEGLRRELAMFNFAIENKLRGCDLVRLQVDDVCAAGRVGDRATVVQEKTGRPVQFEIPEPVPRASPCAKIEIDIAANRVKRCGPAKQAIRRRTSQPSRTGRTVRLL